MTSQARIDANRQNAQLSTGPRSQEGKQASSKNATKHGFFARLLPIETPAFQDMLTGLYYALRPADEMQQLLVDQIGIAYLRLARLYQQELQPKSMQPVTISADADSAPSTQHSALLLRYETMLTRQIERNFKLLSEARELRWSFGRMFEQPPYFLPDFTGEDDAPDPTPRDEHAPDAAETSPAADTRRTEATLPYATETAERASTLEPPADPADTVAHPYGEHDEACADDLQTASCAEDPSLDHHDDRAIQHAAPSTQHPSITPVPDHVDWLPGNLHQIDPVTGVMRFRSERPAR